MPETCKNAIKILVILGWCNFWVPLCDFELSGRGHTALSPPDSSARLLPSALPCPSAKG